MLTQEKLKELVHYNPETGIFTRLTHHHMSPYGSVIGNKDKDGYLEAMVDGKRYKLHRLAFLYMLGNFPKYDVEHDDRDKANNKWNNLFDILHEKNQKNLPKQRNNTSGCTGVVYHKRYDLWQARINHNRVTVNLGYYKCKEDAVVVRQQANIKYGYHTNHGK